MIKATLAPLSSSAAFSDSNTKLLSTSTVIIRRRIQQSNSDSAVNTNKTSPGPQKVFIRRIVRRSKEEHDDKEKITIDDKHRTRDHTTTIEHNRFSEQFYKMFKEGGGDVQMSHGMPLLNMNSVHPSLMNGESADSDRQCSTDRSISATPSQNGDDHQELDDDTVGDGVDMNGHGLSDDNETQTVAQEISDLKTNFIYMSHQITRIMKTLHVAPCMCDVCAGRLHQAEMARNEDPRAVLQALFPAATAQQLTALTELSKISTPQIQRNNMSIGQKYSQLPGGGKMSLPIQNCALSGQSDKRMVAEYARVHGAVAAAKRFGVPPPVSTYYQRKDSSNALGSATSPGPSSEGESDGAESTPISQQQVQQLQQAVQQHQQQQAVLQQQQQNAMSANTPQSQQAAAAQQQQQQNGASNGGISTPTGQNPMFFDMMKMNAAHATGSPGFLRGRGRGRPKLIGDELDADLVDYMVTVKQSDPHGHLTASNALLLAKQYILDKAPGLLEEQGGHVKLKLTWAMKLVSRIAERQKEMELGLPAGTLSNMGRHQLNNLPGGNFMADVMAQNILSQHMMNMNQIQVKQEYSHDGSEKDQHENDFPSAQLAANGGVMTEAMAQSIIAQHLRNQQMRQEQEDNKDYSSSAVSTPEILNVKELQLPFLTNLFGGSSDENSGLILDGQLPDNDCEEAQMDLGAC